MRKNKIHLPPLKHSVLYSIQRPHPALSMLLPELMVVVIVEDEEGAVVTAAAFVGVNKLTGRFSLIQILHM